MLEKCVINNILSSNTFVVDKMLRGCLEIVKFGFYRNVLNDSNKSCAENSFLDDPFCTNFSYVFPISVFSRQSN